MFGNAAFAQLPLATAGGGLFAASVSETASVADTANSALNFAGNVSEAVNVADYAIFPDVNCFGGAFFADTSFAGAGLYALTLTASVSVNSAVSETGSTADSANSAINFAGNVSEAVNVADYAIFSDINCFGGAFFADTPFAGAGLYALTLTASVNFGVSITEAASAVEAVNSSINFASNVLESASATDTADTASSFSTNISESASTFDNTSALSAFVTNISESASTLDTTSALSAFVTSILENVDTLDTPSSIGVFHISVAEAVNATDADSAAATFISSLVESASVTDAAARRFLWELIDDTQTPGWTDILVATTITDIGTFGGMAFAASPFAGSETTTINPNINTWTQINDNTTANWTEIVT
jgi:hypothetical protein